MARNRSAPRRRLTFEQQALMSSMGMLLCSEEGESNLDTATRIFGSVEAARAAWYAHREAALAADPVAGRRPPLWWLFERGMDPPRVGEEEEALLRELGFLTLDEVGQLEEWRSMPRMPEIPRDLGLDQVAIDPISESIFTEDPDATPVAARPTGPPTDPGAASQATPEEVVEAVVDVEDEPPTKENVVKPHILSAPTPWYQQNGPPREIEGWE